MEPVPLTRRIAHRRCRNEDVHRIAHRVVRRLPNVEGGKGAQGRRPLMATEAQLKATAKYQKEKVRQVSVKFFPAEADIYEHLMAQGNKNGYIKALIRADMERAKQ